jgi:hypothetical protein
MILRAFEGVVFCGKCAVLSAFSNGIGQKGACFAKVLVGKRRFLGRFGREVGGWLGAEV